MAISAAEGTSIGVRPWNGRTRIVVPRDRQTGSPIQVTVVGEVVGAGQYSVASGSTVLEVIAAAGGFTPSAAIRRLKIMRSKTMIRLERHTEKRGVTRVTVIWYEAESSAGSIHGDFIVQDGDVVLASHRLE